MRYVKALVLLTVTMFCIIPVGYAMSATYISENNRLTVGIPNGSIVYHDYRGGEIIGRHVFSKSGSFYTASRGTFEIESTGLDDISPTVEYTSGFDNSLYVDIHMRFTITPASLYSKCTVMFKIDDEGFYEVEFDEDGIADYEELPRIWLDANHSADMLVKVKMRFPNSTTVREQPTLGFDMSMIDQDSVCVFSYPVTNI